MPLIVYLASSGRSLELECLPSIRVSEIQQVLAELTGTPPADQILTHEGAPLAPAALLADYGLAGSAPEGDAPASDVFLYSRAQLRPDAPPPVPEALPPLPPFDPGESALLPPEPDGDDAPHPLDGAGSPLLRALPQYRRQFRGHLRAAEAAAAGGAARVALCCRLLNEAEVQAMAVDAAMASVEPHYNFIVSAQTAFQERFSRRYGTHQDVLATFDADAEFLSSVELPPQLQLSFGEGGPPPRTLADLVDLQELRSVAAECRRSHTRFAARVTELDALHAALRADVEALFMRAPSADLDALSQGLAAAAAAADEQATAAQALAADCCRADAAAADATDAAAPGFPVPPGLQDTVGMLEAMHEAHVGTVLPRVEENGAAIEAFARRCVDAKNALAADALAALRTVASQQSKIREMKEAMAPFPVALDRQDAQIGLLLAVRRLPAAYKQALAECLRRAAFAEKYTAFAADLAERMGRFREKEMAMRDKFRGHVGGHLPPQLLDAMGLGHPPPHCEVSVPGDEAAALLPVTPEDLRRLALPRHGVATAVTAAGTAEEAPSPTAASSAAERGPASAAAAGGTGASSLQLQNMQLRAELASQIALGCIQAAELAALSGPAPTASAASASSSGGSGGTPPAGALPPDAVAKFERALAAKDALVAVVKEQGERQTAALQRRVEELQAALAAASVAAAPDEEPKAPEEGEPPSGASTSTEHRVSAASAAETQEEEEKEGKQAAAVDSPPADAP